VCVQEPCVYLLWPPSVVIGNTNGSANFCILRRLSQCTIVLGTVQHCWLLSLCSKPNSCHYAANLSSPVLMSSRQMFLFCVVYQYSCYWLADKCFCYVQQTSIPEDEQTNVSLKCSISELLSLCSISYSVTMHIMTVHVHLGIQLFNIFIIHIIIIVTNRHSFGPASLTRPGKMYSCALLCRTRKAVVQWISAKPSQVWNRME
jgi:hypothetical protein